MWRGLALVCTIGGLAAAEPRPTLVGAAGDKNGVVLVGSQGEIYARGDGVWRRRGGGVAATLTRAWGTSATDLHAVGARQPAYAHDGKSWFALPGTSAASGPTLLAEPGSAVTAVAVGRRIFVLQGGKLVPVTATPGLATAFFAGGPRDFLALVDGKLQRFAGGWKPVPGADENLVAIGPRLAFGVDGGVYAVDARLRKLAVDPTLADFRPRLVASGKRTIVVGAQGDGHAAAAVDGNRVAPLGKLPGLARTDEPVAVVVVPGASETEIVVVSRSGLVLVGDGATWKTEAIAAAVSETRHAVEPPAPVK